MEPLSTRLALPHTRPNAPNPPRRLAPSPTPLPLHQLQALQAQLQALGSGALAPLPGAPLPLQLPDPFARPLVFSIGDRQARGHARGCRA